MKYVYHAYTNDKKVKSGTIDAPSEKLAEENLLRNGFQRVLNLRANRSVSHRPGGFSLSFSSVSNSDILAFTHELADLLHAGISITSALRLLEKQTKKTALKEVIATMAADLNAGKSFSQAIEKHPDIFSTTYCEVMNVVEHLGNLHTGLQYMADYIEKQEGIRKRITRALTYPALVVLLAIGVGALLVTLVLPPLVDLFDSLGSDLPFTTKVVFVFSNFIIDNKIAILVTVLCLIIAVVIYARIPSGKRNIDRLLLKLPFIGQITLKTNLMRFTYTSAILLKAGIQISKVLPTSIRTITNYRIQEVLTEAGDKLLHGQPFSHVMEATGIFPANYIEMLAVGEKTGELDTSLSNIARNLEKTNTEKVDTMIATIEPALTVAIGLAIGFIALAIITPIYSLAGSM